MANGERKHVRSRFAQNNSMTFSLVDPSYLQDEEIETDIDLVTDESTELVGSSLVSYTFHDEVEVCVEPLCESDSFLGPDNRSSSGGN